MNEGDKNQKTFEQALEQGISDLVLSYKEFFSNNNIFYAVTTERYIFGEKCYACSVGISEESQEQSLCVSYDATKEDAHKAFSFMCKILSSFGKEIFLDGKEVISDSSSDFLISQNNTTLIVREEEAFNTISIKEYGEEFFDLIKFSKESKPSFIYIVCNFIGLVCAAMGMAICPYMDLKLNEYGCSQFIS